MRNLVRRAKSVYRDEGLRPVVEKSARFVPRYVRHVIGVKGLYRRPRYRSLLLWWNSRPYTAVADPFTIVKVDPNRIIHVTGRGPNPGRFQWQDLGKIEKGNWDMNDERFEDLPVVRALRQRFEDGIDWENVEFVQQVIAQVEHGNVIWRGCSNEQEVWNACTRVDRLYERIQSNGYRSKQSLVEQGEAHPDKYTKGDGFNRYDEVVVDIGRDGQFLFVDGRHRLAIAKILGLEEIPVRISARHTEWQRIREEFDQTASLDQLPASVRDHLGHPDLGDVWSE